MNIVLDVLRYLKEHDITLVKAAEATGVAQQNIKKSIGNNPKTSTLLALAKGLGVDPREFFYDLDEKEEKEKNDIQENIEENLLLESPDITEEETKDQNDVENPVQSDYTEEISNTEEAQPADTEEKDKAVTDNIVNTTTFCPHCGAKVRVGVVLLPEE
ncbi:helix-turn-helix domain-containing protein [Prevotella sp.]|uniref:helix-turn-helix domain-containing protein n=1 Tax=Prevotella sp. TaxID=59823 RepID=UPI003F7D88A6